MSRSAWIAGTLAAGAVLLVVMDLQADRASRDAFVAGWTRDTESEAAFVAATLARKNDLLVVERFTALVKRDDLSYAVVCDAAGRARFHTNASDVGTVYDSPVARRALAAAGTVVQHVTGAGVVEVDVPVGGGAVLRMGYATRAYTGPSRWLWAGAAVSVVAAAAAGLMARARA